MAGSIDAFLETVGAFVKNVQVPVVGLIAVLTPDPHKVLVATILSARTKEALAQLPTRHAAGERVLGESREVPQEAVEGILETFVFNHADRKKGLKETETTREREHDLIPAVLPAVLADDSSS